MKRKTAIGLVVLMLCTLMGCGKKQVDYVDSTEGQNGEVQTVTESTVAVSEEDIPEQLEYTITGDKGTIEVAAEVKMPEDYERCTVMELSIDYLEDEDIVTFADQIFDEGSYFLFMPYNQEEKQFLRDKLITASANVANDREKLVFEWVMEQLDGDEYFVESEEEYEELKFYPNHRLDDESEFCQLFGTIDGINYFLLFQKNGEDCGIVLRRWDKVAYCEFIDVNEDSLDMRLTGNACTYSQEDAEELAREYVNKLGFEQMDIINTTNSMYRDCDLTLVDPYMGGDSGIDGYIVYFGRTYDNYSLTFSTANCSYNYSPFVNLDLKGNPSFYASQGLIGFENIRVYVDSSGICDMEIFNPMKEEGPMAGDIVLLPFEKVDSIAQDEIQKFADSTSGDWKVTEVELGYGMVEEDGKTALVPVWYYFCESNVNETVYVRTALLMINALDGTVIGYE